jgi:hypothetical protein
MAWALALVVVIGVGLPLAAWWFTRRLPARRRSVDRLGIGYDAIDKWLLDRYQLPPHDRWRVRTAVFQGRQVSDATLAPAVHGLATRVLTGGFRVLRLSQVLGWVDLMVATGLAGAGLVLLITSHHAEGLVLGVISLVSSGLFMFAGVMRALRFPQQIRHNVVKALQLNQDGT